MTRPYTRVLTTPLHLDVAAESRTNSWVDWNGYTAASVLTDLDEEYRALRHAAALSDISPLVKYRIGGKDAARFLQRLVTGNILTLPVNASVQVAFCEDRGFILGDGLLSRLGETEYRLITEETYLAWLLDSTTGMDVSVEDISTALAAISLQGPLSCRILAGVFSPTLADLPPHAARWFEIAGISVYLSRTGNSGGLGYELWVDADDASTIWKILLDKGTPLGARVTGFQVREIARIEAGIPRAGVDYLSAFAATDPASASTPFELGYASLVNLEGDDFTGRDALRIAKASPPAHMLVPVVVEWPEPLHFAAIRGPSFLAGLATSHAFSRSLGVNLALARLAPQSLLGNTPLHVMVEVRREMALGLIEAPVRLLRGPALVFPERFSTPAPIL